jgi:phosphatidylserine/phosphatidylglycerophosphate/cardiolipin synthase-like enzyme
MPTIISRNRILINQTRRFRQFAQIACQDIAAAKHQVHLEFCIFANDRAGKKIMVTLEEAQARGVKCRILIDAIGSFSSIGAIKRRLKPQGTSSSWTANAVFTASALSASLTELCPVGS